MCGATVVSDPKKFSFTEDKLPLCLAEWEDDREAEYEGKRHLFEEKYSRNRNNGSSSRAKLLWQPCVGFRGWDERRHVLRLQLIKTFRTLS